ncbi:hypothetical protein V1507DRAFT_446351 [Lipomyces tetrasporus]
MSVKAERLRKGTHSCWECKPRKMRCIFDPRDGTVCIGCWRRGSRCVGQELPEEMALVQMRGGGGNPPFSNNTPTAYHRPSHGVPTPVSTSTTVEPSREQDDPPSSHARHLGLSGLLHASLPSRDDTQRICRASWYPSILAHEIMTLPYATLDEIGLKSPTVLLDVPELHAHPVLIARHMLLLATFLQHQDISGLSESPRAIAERLIDQAVSCVTTNDKLLGSIEALECVMIESVYHANIGNLRPSWLSGRRAMNIAHLMGLNRPYPQTQYTILDPRSSYDPQLMWFRIVLLDRYLCLMLGVSQGCLDRSMASEALLGSDMPLGRLERIHCVIASRILERNESKMSAADEHTLTPTLDAELKSAARSLPSRWWLTPTLDKAPATGTQERFWNIRRMFAQVLHYNLLNQLHLPYMLRASSSSSGDRRYEYARITCVSASRELHRHSCRTVDFFALMAAMTLLLAHLDSQVADSENLLTHQYHSDRAMIEQVQENMKEVNSLSWDALSAQSADLLRQLLAVDVETADGDPRSPNLNNNAVVSVHIPYFGIIKIALEGISKEMPKPPAATAAEPAMGPSRLARPSGTPDAEGLTPVDVDSHEMPSAMSDICAQIQLQPGALSIPAGVHEGAVGAAPAERPEDWAFQGTDMAFFENLMRGAGDDGVYWTVEASSR